MKVSYEHKPAMTFIGFSTSIRPEEGYQKCPEFWDKEYARKYARLWQTMQPETPVEKAILENGVGLFAICDEKEGTFEYWIAGPYHSHRDRKAHHQHPAQKSGQCPQPQCLCHRLVRLG